MDNSKSVVSSGAYGIPKWILKKGMRYEVDDFIVSPPSIDEGGFMRLRYGRSSTTQDPNITAAHNHKQQDGGMTVEVRDDTLQFSSDLTPTSTTISIGPGGLSVEPSPLTTPETAHTSASHQHPLLVLPMNFGAQARESPASPTSASPDTPQEGQQQQQQLQQQQQYHPLKQPERRHSQYSSHSSILDKIQSLSINTSPTSSSGIPSPVTSPITTPKASPTFNRKLIHMDPQRKISAHSYFCTKQYLDQISRPIKEEETIKQVDESSLPPQALDPKMMGRRRRQPKPSTLREMNFWAPTSM